MTVYVTVRDNNVDQALRVLKKKLQREGVFREMKNRRAYEKPSERRAREAAESTRRVRKLDAQADGARRLLEPVQQNRGKAALECPRRLLFCASQRACAVS